MSILEHDTRAVQTPTAAPPGALVEVRDVAIDYRVGGDDIPALREVFVRVDRGEIVALVGESGSGKSTLATSIIRLLPTNGRVTAGSIELDGVDVTRLSEKELRRIRGLKVGYVPQDPMTSLTPTFKIGRQVIETMIIHRTHTRAQAYARARVLLEEAGLRDVDRVMGMYPHELSGGMRQRVLIAMAFAGDPDLIIADEPTSALDVTVARGIMDRLSLLVREHRKALLIITHDLAMALHRADYLVVMKQGRVVETGTPADIESAPAAEYTRQLLDNSPHLAVAHALEDPTPARIEQTRFDDGDSALLQVTGLRKVFRSGHGKTARDFVAVEDISFCVPAGATYGIVGESGSGKSTTARMVLRLEDPTAGRIVFRGRDITEVAGEDLRSLRRQIQVVYQSPFDSMNPRLTIGEIIQEPGTSFRLGSRADRRRKAASMLDAVGLPAAYMDRRPTELSGGQRQRVAIARALSIEPALVVLDEPISALDVLIQAQILQLLRELQREFDVSYLFISHDLATVQNFADHVAVMKAGRVVETGAPDEVFRSPREDYTRGLVASALEL